MKSLKQKSSLTKSTIDVPTLFIQATNDSVLQPSMAKGMERYLTNLTRAEVKATHWALTQKPDEANAIIQEWLEKEVLSATARL
jgi:soluble epoxide hydrolase / lipid-phosphate phosphatase